MLQRAGVLKKQERHMTYNKKIQGGDKTWEDE